MMAFDNRAANGESDSHPVIFRSVERLEKPVRNLWGESDSCILHRQTHMIVFVSLSSDQQLPGTIVNCTHGVGSIPKQVQNDLLQLHTIARDKRQTVCCTMTRFL